MRGWWAIAAVCAGCISENRRAAGDTTSPGDGDVPDIIPCEGCVIGDTCFGLGDVNPANPCEACVPTDADDKWSPAERLGGPVACDDDDPCTPSGSCSEGQCLVPLVDVACPDAPSCVVSVGCDCSFTLAPATCLIEGACWGAGDEAPGNPCMVCAPAVDGFAWSFGTGPCDDAEPCTVNDQCDQGQCAGAPMACSDSLSCTIDFCDGGQCQHQLPNQWCLIDDVCYETGDESAANPCMQCDPQLSQRQFAPAVAKQCDDENKCSSDSRCDAQGTCVGEIDSVDDEPNDLLANAQDVGIVDPVEVFPSGVVPANHVDVSDRDLFRWGMAFSSNGLIYEPKLFVEADGPTPLEVCLYARCGQTAQTAAKPLVTCRETFDRAQLDDDTQGCCVDVSPNQGASMILSASCNGATVLGFAYASVQPKTGVDAATCGGYVLQWGATD